MWYEAGWSKSRYYYTAGTVIIHTNDPLDNLQFLSFDNTGHYDEVHDVLEAINYKNYSFLSNQAEYEWQRGGVYYENWFTGW